MANPQPKVLIFDLDYTLWPFWVDTHVTPPFKKSSNGNITDIVGYKIKCYPEVPDVLKSLYDKGYVLSVASRTGEIEGAKQLVKLFDWEEYFVHKQIFPGSKTTHVKSIREKTGVGFHEIIFFDDEERNIRDVTKLGVLSILVHNGVNKRVIEDAFMRYSKRTTTTTS